MQLPSPIRQSSCSPHAGESKDASNTEGSFLLTDDERDLIQKVTGQFDHVAVLLNVGNIIDMSWVEEYGVESVMYVWHGGMEGGKAPQTLSAAMSRPPAS